jgi:hypothetical protein
MVDTRTMRLWVLLVLSVFFAPTLGLGCTDASGDGADGVREPIVSTSTGEEPSATNTPAEPSDPEAERQAKQAHRESGETEVLAVDWRDAESHPRTDTSALSEDARAAALAATLPVLLPRDAALLTGATLTHGPTWYAASLHPEGHHITINGRRLAVHQPALSDDVPPDRRRQPGELSLSRTHGIVTGAFEAFGVSYTFDVECAAPSTDVRCTEDAYARSLFETLGVAGGAP